VRAADAERYAAESHHEDPLPLFVFLSTMLTSLVYCSAREWNGIVPLKSNRADVERLLGNSSDGIYHYGKQIVDVEYARFPCGHKNPPGWHEPPPGWNVPVYTVTAIRVSLGKDIVPLESLPYDLNKFVKVRGDRDLPQHFYYTNDADGFAIEFFDFGGKEGSLVRAFLYTPTANEEKGFRCKN